MEAKSVNDLKKMFEAGELKPELYSAKVDGVNGEIRVGEDGFEIRTPGNNGWTTVMIYEFLDGEWYVSETYEK